VLCRCDVRSELVGVMIVVVAVLGEGEGLVHTVLADIVRLLLLPLPLLLIAMSNRTETVFFPNK
jgi:hypothetical protein